jgi:hypothetical protein
MKKNIAYEAIDHKGNIVADVVPDFHFNNVVKPNSKQIIRTLEIDHDDVQYTKVRNLSEKQREAVVRATMEKYPMNVFRPN